MHALSFSGRALRLRLAVPVHACGYVYAFSQEEHSSGFICLIESNSVSGIGSRSYTQYWLCFCIPVLSGLD